MANENTRKKIVGVAMTPDQRTELEAAAKSEGVTISTYAHRCIVRSLAGIKAGRTRRSRAQEEPQGDAA